MDTRPGKRLQKTMTNHHVSWVDQLFLWPFSMSLFVCLPGRVARMTHNLCGEPHHSWFMLDVLPHIPIW